jgi:L-asparaginase II
LRTPPAYPIDDQARDEWVRSGHATERITMNCSGKHAAMIATCVANGWPIHDDAMASESATQSDKRAFWGGSTDPWGPDDYRSRQHPLQQAIRTATEDSAGEKVSHVAVDGCGAPLLAISLAGLARSFGLFASAAPSTMEGRIADAFRTHPEYASGSRRDEAALMKATPGLLCKAGAEAVYAVGLPDGRGIAVKIDDGGVRARAVVMAATLQRLGLDNDTIQTQREYILSGGGLPVGSVRPTPL